MNESIDLTKILKDCPKGTEFYSTIWGKIFFELIIHHPDEDFPVRLKNNNNEWIFLTKEGKYNHIYEDSECILFPSKDQRDWNKFSAPWFKSNTSIVKKEKFDPKTLKSFDKVLVRDSCNYVWVCDLFSHIEGIISDYKYRCVASCYKYCIPYNDDTKYLLNTYNLPPENYIYWDIYKMS